ncbi:MAG: Gfo/Idh/MocA family oxidoreductase [Pseudomonadales bacterium]|nr:Gfo/Idh/MocA family oxidoreductase [Pseudomonadales bacterium]
MTQLETRHDETALSPSTPMDVRLGLTDPKDDAFPLRWGIIGAGQISRQWVPAVRACKGATVSAVAARSKERAEDFAAQHEIESAYGSYAEMLASPDVDIVYVGTIHTLHKEHALLAIEAGKHVLCEKPLGGNAEEAKQMYEAAARQGVMLQHGLWTRFFPAVEHARWALEQGMIGDVVMVQADFDPVYTIQAAVLAFGIEVRPIITTFPKATVLEYPEDRSAVLSFITYLSEFPERTEIVGTKGRITLEQPAHCPTGITLRVPEKVPSRYLNANTPAPAHRFEYPIPETVSIPMAYPNQSGFLYQAEAVHRCLAAGLLECPQFGKQESLYFMDLLEVVLGR